MKYAKSSYSQYLKKLKTSYPNNTSTRHPLGAIHEKITHREFKLVLPMVLKDKISGKGANLKPEYPCIETMNVMINCLKLNEYNEAPCGTEIKEFTECFQKYSADVKLADEQAKKGVFKIEENQSKFPVKFMQKMLKDFKTPRKVDNGPDIPV